MSFYFESSDAVEQILCFILASLHLAVNLGILLFFFLFLCVLYFFLLGGPSLKLTHLLSIVVLLLICFVHRNVPPNLLVNSASPLQFCVVGALGALVDRSHFLSQRLAAGLRIQSLIELF